MSECTDSLQTRCGTPLFAAPEILANKGDGYTKVVDSWSLGVMVFIMSVDESASHSADFHSLWDIPG